ncbi:hypothetical protein AB0885_41175, partial [Streptomyces sp. NPDC005534]
MNVVDFMQSFFSDGAHWHGYDGIPQRVWEHLQYTAGALAIAAAIGLPVGLVTGHTARGGNALAFLSAGARALPTFGLLVLMFVWLGLGIVPVMIPLVVLAIPPILITTYEAVRTVVRIRTLAAVFVVAGVLSWAGARLWAAVGTLPR